MILTGDFIQKSVKKGDIVISGFDEKQINPNSYNYRLGPRLKVFEKYDGEKSIFKEIDIPQEGYILKAKTLYLGHTLEVIGSKKYAMSLIGRSSIGRLGLFMQVSANLGHTTSCHQWTLEIYPIIPIKVYPKMTIGQVSFWCNKGFFADYQGKFGRFNEPQESFIAL